MVRLTDIESAVVEKSKYLSGTISIGQAASKVSKSWADFVKLAIRAGVDVSLKRISHEDMARIEKFMDEEIDGRPISIRSLAKKLKISFYEARKLRLEGMV